MKILVPVKRVVDHNVRIRVKTDHSGVDTGHVKMSVNPFDEIALEEALRLKDAEKADEIVVVTAGEKKAQEQLRTAMAMGADRAIHIQLTPDQAATLEPLAVAKCFKEIALREKPGLVLIGKQAIDDDSNQTGQMLAALLGWPQGTFVSSLSVFHGEIRVRREIDGGAETLNLKLPAIVTADLRLNDPRRVSLPNILKAKQKPVETLSPDDLGVSFTPRLQTLQIDEVSGKRNCEKLPDVDTLIARLRNNAKVI